MAFYSVLLKWPFSLSGHFLSLDRRLSHRSSCCQVVSALWTDVFYGIIHHLLCAFRAGDNVDSHNIWMKAFINIFLGDWSILYLLFSHLFPSADNRWDSIIITRCCEGSTRSPALPLNIPVVSTKQPPGASISMSVMWGGKHLSEVQGIGQWRHTQKCSLLWNVWSPLIPFVFSLLTFHNQTIHKLFCFANLSYQSVFQTNKLTIICLGRLLGEKQLMVNLQTLKGRIIWATPTSSKP